MTTVLPHRLVASVGRSLAAGPALLLATLGVLAMTATPTAAQSLTRGPVLIETHHTDLAGNIRLSTNEAGDVTQHLDYAPFGEVDGRSCTGGGDPTLSPKFQGKLRDPKTCLDDFGARDYYMVTGRFQSVDPVLPIETALRDPQQWNRYAYARNNPLIYTDPDGRFFRLLVEFILRFEANLEAPPAPGQATEPSQPRIADDLLDATIDMATGGGRGRPASVVHAAKVAGKGASVVKGSVEWHHLLPQAERFQQFFKSAGLDVEDFKIPLDKAKHRLKPDGVHTNGGGNWNRVWSDFFKDHPNATRQEILDQLAKMRGDFGI